jgi:hypothetical protein
VAPNGHPLVQMRFGLTHALGLRGQVVQGVWEPKKERYNPQSNFESQFLVFRAIRTHGFSLQTNLFFKQTRSWNGEKSVPAQLLYTIYLVFPT